MQAEHGNPIHAARESGRLIILIDASRLPFHAAREGHDEVEVVALDTFHEAIGELATRLQAGEIGEHHHPLIVAPVGRLAEDAQEVTAALRRLHPPTRVVGVKTPGEAHDERLLATLGIDLLPSGDLEDALDLAGDADDWDEADQADVDEPIASGGGADASIEADAGAPETPQRDAADTKFRTSLLGQAWPGGGSLGFAEIPAPEDPPVPHLLEEHATARITGMADEGLAALLSDSPQQIPAAAIELLHRRLGLASLYLLAPGEKPIPDRDGVHIRLSAADGRLLGTLVVDEKNEHLAYAWSGWLTSWLRAAEHVRQLQLDADLDPLTGAFNRRALLRYLQQSIESAKERRQALTVMVFDVDGLKAYNDTYGHAAGDDVLRETVRLLRSVIRPGDRVCRIGGDEFVVVFYDPAGPRSPDSEHPRSAEELAKRFQSQVARCRFPKLGDEAPGRLSVSGGLSTYPWDGVDAETLIRRADERAMRAKREGKNAIIFGPAAVEKRDERT